MTSIAIAFMAVTLLSVPGFGGNAYAAGAGMTLSLSVVPLTSIVVEPRTESLAVIVSPPAGALVVSATAVPEVVAILVVEADESDSVIVTDRPYFPSPDPCCADIV